MEKVYCKNCKFRKTVIVNQGGGYEYRCLKDKSKVLYNIYNGKFNDFRIWTCLENEKGDCKYYKRKWWKFWVR